MLILLVFLQLYSLRSILQLKIAYTSDLVHKQHTVL